MRYRYFTQFMTFVVLFVVDFIFQAVFNSLQLPSIFFVSQFHFIALVLYAREDSRVEILTKVIIVCFIMDLIHYQSFPIYYIAYGISILLIRFWHRHISDSFFEKMLIVGVALFIKEFLLFKTLEMYVGFNTTFMHFLSQRSFWIILVSVVFLKVPVKIIDLSEKMIKNYSKRHYQ